MDFCVEWTFVGMIHFMKPMKTAVKLNEYHPIRHNCFSPSCSFGLKSILLSGGLWEVFKMISRRPLDNDCSAVGEQLCAWRHMTAGCLPQKCTRPSFCHLLWRTCNCSLKSSTHTAWTIIIIKICCLKTFWICSSSKVHVQCQRPNLIWWRDGKDYFTSPFHLNFD